MAPLLAAYGSHALHRRVGVDRGHVDDGAAARCAQVRDRVVAHEVDALEVGVDDLVPLLLGAVLDTAVQEHGGIVHDDVEAAEALDRPADEALDVRALRDISADEVDRQSLGGQLLDELGAQLLAPAGGHHGRTFAGEQNGRRTADP